MIINEDKASAVAALNLQTWLPNDAYERQAPKTWIPSQKMKRGKLGRNQQ